MTQIDEHRRRIRQRLAELHPDTNGGSHAHVRLFTSLAAGLRRALCKCSCGRMVKRTGETFYDRTCARIYRARKGKLLLQHE